MDPDTGAFNESGLVENMKLKAGSFYGKQGLTIHSGSLLEQASG
jgi:hypothetical protein